MPSHDFYWPDETISRADSDSWERELAELREHAFGAVETDVEHLIERVAEESTGIGASTLQRRSTDDGIASIWLVERRVGTRTDVRNQRECND